MLRPNPATSLCSQLRNHGQKSWSDAGMCVFWVKSSPKTRDSSETGFWSHVGRQQRQWEEGGQGDDLDDAASGVKTADAGAAVEVRPVR